MYPNCIHACKYEYMSTFTRTRARTSTVVFALNMFNNYSDQYTCVMRIKKKRVFMWSLTYIHTCTEQ